ncbi:hypothetical protein IJ556_02325 [bacterium]|nr:hypothetical protein [bacterium]
MKLVSITCPNCGAKLQATPNAKTLTCDYCNCDVMVDDEVKRVQLQNAEQAGYEFEKGRRRAIEEAEQAAKQANIEAERRAEEERRLAASYMWVTCPNCGTDLKVKKDLTVAVCKYCNHDINVTLGLEICWASGYLRTANYKEAMKAYLRAYKIDPNNKLIKWGIDYINEKYNYTFIRVNVPHMFTKDESLEFRFNCMAYIKNSGKEEIYNYSDMQNIDHDSNSFWFDYPGYVRRHSFTTEAPEYVYHFLMNAKQGVYD